MKVQIIFAHANGSRSVGFYLRLSVCLSVFRMIS